MTFEKRTRKVNRRRYFRLLLILSFVFSVPALSSEVEVERNESDSDKSFDTRTRPNKPPNIPADTIFITKTKEEDNWRAGIIRIDDGVGILFPYKNYGYRLNLATFSPEFAEKYWGKSRTSVDGTYITFDVWGALVSDNREKNLFHIDTKFKNGRMAYYRLRGIGISNPKWINCSSSRFRFDGGIWKATTIIRLYTNGSAEAWVVRKDSNFSKTLDWALDHFHNYLNNAPSFETSPAESYITLDYGEGRLGDNLISMPLCEDTLGPNYKSEIAKLRALMKEK